MGSSNHRWWTVRITNNVASDPFYESHREEAVIAPCWRRSSQCASCIKDVRMNLRLPGYFRGFLECVPNIAKCLHAGDEFIAVDHVVSAAKIETKRPVNTMKDHCGCSMWKLAAVFGKRHAPRRKLMTAGSVRVIGIATVEKRKVRRKPVIDPTILTLYPCRKIRPRWSTGPSPHNRVVRMADAPLDYAVVRDRKGGSHSKEPLPGVQLSSAAVILLTPIKANPSAPELPLKRCEAGDARDAYYPKAFLLCCIRRLRENGNRKQPRADAIPFTVAYNVVE